MENLPGDSPLRRPAARRTTPMKPHIVGPALIAVTGGFVTFVHDYAYRRVGGDDYEFGGLISHAGTDMLITTLACTLVALAYLLTTRER